MIAIAILAIAAISTLSAQPRERLVKVQVAPENTDWVYDVGEKVKFNVTVLRNNIAIPDAEISYELSEDTATPFKRESAKLKNGKLVIDGGKLKEPGFLRCRVIYRDGDFTYDGLGTAAVEPLNVEPTTVLPDDFVEFWDRAKEQNAKVPMDPIVTLATELCTGSVDVYYVSIQNFNIGGRIHGVLSVPKAEGKHPAIIYFPGAGVRPYKGNIAEAEKGNITFEIGVHGIPVNLPQVVYDDLSGGPLRAHYRAGLDSRDDFYYKRIYLGAVRAVDFITSLPEYSGDLTVHGGSQGGALAVVTAALDERVDRLVVFCPAFCELTGYYNNRSGGWPHLFRGSWDKATPEKLETVKYYDVVNFARQLKTPGFYSTGYNDITCSPTSVFSAYNSITAPKMMMVVEDIGHHIYPEQYRAVDKWIEAERSK